MFGTQFIQKEFKRLFADILLQENTPSGQPSEFRCIKLLVNMTIILVTGANRGIGFAIVQAAAGKILDATFILGCRSLEAGREAAQKLRDLQPNATFDVAQIDIEDDESILAAVTHITEKYGKLDGQLLLCSTNCWKLMASKFSSTTLPGSAMQSLRTSRTSGPISTASSTTPSHRLQWSPGHFCPCCGRATSPG